MNSDTEKPLADYEVLLCVTGGIACYKAADLTSKLVQAGAGVSVAMTEAAEKFVGPVTFQALTRRHTYTTLWQSTQVYSTQHIALTDQADLLILAPATANAIAKMATGLADDLVSTLTLAATGSCPVLIAPAMNERMWAASPTQHNMKLLREWGVNVIGPGEGYLACGTIGQGRMVEPAEILEAARKLLLKAPPKNLKPQQRIRPTDTPELP